LGVGTIAAGAVGAAVLTLPKGRSGEATQERQAIKGLRSFELKDAEIFKRLEREKDVRECFEALRDSELRLGILMGESGAGKSSLLQAGLMPRLGEANFQGVYVKLGDRDPISLIRKALTAPEGEEFLPMLENAVERAGKPIVLILDQFEQFFVQFQEAERSGFIAALKAWYESDVSVKVLIGIRGDLSDRLVEIQKALGYSLRPTQVYRLEKFAPEQATNVLKVIAETEGLAFNQQFVLEVARDELAGPDGKVSPVDVQILAQMISREANEENRTFDKQAFQKLGGVDGLLGRSLKRSLDTILSKSERERTLEVLLALTDLERNVRAGQFSLAKLQKMPGKVRGGPLEVVAVVQWLMEARLITPVEQEGNVAYELAHERLIPALRQVANQELSAVNRANMLLDQRVNEWLGSGRKQRYLFSLGELRLLRQQQGFLQWGQRESQKRELLGQSWARSSWNLGFLGLPIGLLLVFGGWSNTPSGQIQWTRWNLMALYKLGVPELGYRETNESNVGTALSLDMIGGMKNNPVPYFWLDSSISENYGDETLSEMIRIAEKMKDRDAGKRLLNQVSLISSNSKDSTIQTKILLREAEGYIVLQDEIKARELLFKAPEAVKAMKEEYEKTNGLITIANIYRKLNESNKAQQVLSEAVEIVKSNKNEMSRFYGIISIAAAYSKLNDNGKAEQALSDAQEVAKSIKDEQARTSAIIAIASIYSKLNDSSKAQQLLSEALKMTKLVKNEETKPFVLVEIASAYRQLRDSSKAQLLLSEALQLTKSMREDDYKIAVITLITGAAVRLDNSSKTQQLLAKTLEFTKSANDEYYKTTVMVRIADAYGKLKDSSKAQKILSEALEIAKSIKKGDDKTTVLTAIAQAHIVLSDYEKARIILDDLIKIPEASLNSNSISKVAQIHAELGNWGDALRLAQLCRGSEKYAVLARILRVHAEQRNPEFKALREEKPDEAEE
jgi:tetratricopeptide (TPR) repeat protein